VGAFQRLPALPSFLRRTRVSLGDGARQPAAWALRVSKSDQQQVLTVRHTGVDAKSRLGGGTMLGYGLVGTVVVILLIVYLVRGL